MASDNVSKAVDQLSDALNALDDFDKFWREYNEGKIPPIDGSVKSRDQVLDDGQGTRVALVYYIFHCASDVRKNINELLSDEKSSS
jgi:hypothetical protein